MQGQTKRKATKRKRTRKFGFLARLATVGGRRVLQRRRAKGRTQLSVAEEIGSSAVKNKKLRRRK